MMNLVAMEEDRWEMLTKIGDYVADELSDEEARQVERFILEGAERRRLAEAYARMLALLRTTGKEETPDSIEAALNHTILLSRGPAPNSPRDRSWPKMNERQVN